MNSSPGLHTRRDAKGKGYTRQSLIKHARQICSGQYMSQLLKVSVSRNGHPLHLTYRTDAAALARIEQQQLGKRILFTDHQDWSNDQIVLGYRSQSQVEDAFGDMKDPHFLSWEPLDRFQNPGACFLLCSGLDPRQLAAAPGRTERNPPKCASPDESPQQHSRGDQPLSGDG